LLRRCDRKIASVIVRKTPHHCNACMKTLEDKPLPFYKWRYNPKLYWEYRLPHDIERDRFVVFKRPEDENPRLWFLTDYVIPIIPIRFRPNGLGDISDVALTIKEASEPNHDLQLAAIVARKPTMGSIVVHYTTEHFLPNHDLIAKEDIFPLDEFVRYIEAHFAQYLKATELWLYGRR